jgi:hypothetical protein
MTTLLEVRDFLMTVPGSFTFSFGFDSPHPWRGDYYQLAFKPMVAIRANTMLACIDEAVTSLFHISKDHYSFCSSYSLASQCLLDSGGDYSCTSKEEAESFERLFESMKKEYAKMKKRKSKAEKQAEAEQYRQEQKQIAKQKFKETYQTRLLELVSKYLEFDISCVQFRKRKFEFSDICFEFDIEFIDSDNWPDWEEVDNNLQSLEFIIADKIRKIGEANEQIRKQTEALNKLTEEDKRVLGLYTYNFFNEAS